MPLVLKHAAKSFCFLRTINWEFWAFFTPDFAEIFLNSHQMNSFSEQTQTNIFLAKKIFYHWYKNLALILMIDVAKKIKLSLIEKYFLHLYIFFLSMFFSIYWCGEIFSKATKKNENSHATTIYRLGNFKQIKRGIPS